MEDEAISIPDTDGIESEETTEEEVETVNDESIETDETESEEEESETDEGEEEPEEVTPKEMKEFTFGSKKLSVEADKIPPEVAQELDEFSKGIWATFTKEQQANVERAKSLDTMQRLNADALKTFSHGLQLRQEIEQLSQVDLNRLWQSEPDKARQVSDLLAQKTADFHRTVQEVGQQEAQLTQHQQQEMEKAVRTGREALDKKYSGFASNIAPKIRDYVEDTYGVPKSQTESWGADPIATELAYKAMLYDQMKKSVNPVSQQQTKPVKALKSKGGTRSVSRDPAKMSMAEYAKWSQSRER